MKKYLLVATLFLMMTSPALASRESGAVEGAHLRIEKAKENLPSSLSFQALPRAFSSTTREGASSSLSSEVNTERKYAFGEPAGCPASPPDFSNPEAVLSTVQAEIGSQWDLAARRQTYIWNGVLGKMVDVREDPFVYEYAFNEFQPPFTYKADQIVTIFVENGFAGWLRSYGGAFRLTAIPMTEDAANSIWGAYLSAYWQKDGLPPDDTIYPVAKKLPCHWMIDAGWVSNETARAMFSLDWHLPDFTSAGRAYLADTCSKAYCISREKIGYWDATSMCGPLTWKILSDANAFPYRIGSYDANADLFINANPRYWYGRPWNGFDPETYDLVVQTNEPMPGYDFASKGNLYPGDVIFSYGSSGKYLKNNGSFSHVFLVTKIDENGSRFSITNMVQNKGGVKDCSIREVRLYTPGDTETGVINYEWNNHGFGITGHHGFDVFRWKWETYHIEGKARSYTVRWGETLETIGFDWKISPESIAAANQLPLDAVLTPGQQILLPAPDPVWN
jgi:hypothetical protein